MRRTTACTALALATGLALAGCSPSAGQDAASTVPAAPPASASAATGPETYELGRTFTATTPHGAELTVEIPAEGPAEVEQLRKELSVGPVSYAKVGIDNRDGTGDVSVHGVTLYDEDGAAYEFGDLSVDHIGNWGPDRTDALGDRSTTLYGQHLDGTSASELEVSTGWLASTEIELPERITGITLQLDGMGEELPMAPGGQLPEPSRAPSTTAPPARPSAPRDGSPGGAGPTAVPMPGAMPNQHFSYDEAYAAWQDGMPYYDAFCIHYEPTTAGGRSQCEGIEAGTVDAITGEYLGG